MRKFIKFCLKYYGLKDIEVRVKFKKEKHPCLSGAIARVHMHNRRKYTIYCSKGENLTLATIAHELTHIKQFYLRELTYSKKGNFQWYGLTMKHTEYLLTPWEMEARAMEEVLAYAYLKNS